MEVVDRDGNRLGHVFDVVATSGDGESTPHLEGFLIGRGGLARRLGIRRGTARMVQLDDVHSIEDERIVAEINQSEGR
jgi:hypothetical protein